MRWTRAVTATAVAAMMAAGCAGDRDPTPEAAGNPAGDPSAVPLCADVASPEFPAEHLRDEPIYVANEQPVEDLAGWAGNLPGFEELWIDRDHLGWVVLAFSEDADARQAELTERFPEAGAVVLPVDWTRAELADLQDRAAEELDFPVSTGVDVSRGVVEIMVGRLDDEHRDAVNERFSGERVCVDGVHPTDLPPDGPQPDGGDGWRLVADELVGDSYRTGIAADEQGYDRLWAEIGLQGDPPDIDFATEVVIWFGAVYSSSCPDLRLDDVVVDHDRALVHAQIVDLTGAMACTSDANPRAYVVAVQRSALPAGPFAIQLGTQDPPPGAPAERTLVDADLTRPGAALDAGQSGPDPALQDPPAYVAEAGGIVEDGFPTDFRFYLHCGPEWLGPVNDVLWRSEVRDTPAAWRDVLDLSTETLIVEVLLETDPPTLTATANGQAIVYHPTTDAHPGCD